jgi:hypothetical protein
MPMHLDHGGRRDSNTGHAEPYKSSGMITKKP